MRFARNSDWSYWTGFGPATNSATMRRWISPSRLKRQLGEQQIVEGGPRSKRHHLGDPFAKGFAGSGLSSLARGRI